MSLVIILWAAKPLNHSKIGFLHAELAFVVFLSYHSWSRNKPRELFLTKQIEPNSRVQATALLFHDFCQLKSAGRKSYLCKSRKHTYLCNRESIPMCSPSKALCSKLVTFQAGHSKVRLPPANLSCYFSWTSTDLLLVFVGWPVPCFVGSANKRFPYHGAWSE